MALQLTQPIKWRLRKRIILSVFLCLILTSSIIALWQNRIKLATCLVRKVLDQQGLVDLTFTMSSLTPWRVVVENLCLGETAPACRVEWVELRFSYPDILYGRFDRLRVRGVRTNLTVEHDQINSILLQRLQRLSAASAQGSDAARLKPKNSFGLESFGEVSLYDLQVPVRIIARDEILTLRGEVSFVAESSKQNKRPARYRIWSYLDDSAGTQVTVSGTVIPDQGYVVLKPDVAIQQLEPWIARAHGFMSAPTNWWNTIIPTSCSLSVRGSLTLKNWIDLNVFNMAVELSRGSTFNFPSQQASLRFQTMRVEAVGSLADASFKFSTGVSEFSLGKSLQLAQEAGRLLSVRGAGRFKQTTTAQSLNVTCDSDLPGRFVTELLPHILPVFPVFFSNGGTLHAAADLTRDLQAAWQGEVRFNADAIRSSIPLTVGRIGAKAVGLSGMLKITNAVPDEVRMNVTLSEGYLSRQDLAMRGSVTLLLATKPPFQTAEGRFTGSLSESTFLKQRQVFIKNNVIPFEGKMVVTNLVTQPIWKVELRAPDFTMVTTQAQIQAQAHVGMTCKARYDREKLAVESEAWVQDLTVGDTLSLKQEKSAGIERINLSVVVPAFALTATSNAVVQATVAVHNGWINAGTSMVMTQVQMKIPATWSAIKGIDFLPEQYLNWQQIKSYGLNIEPGRFAVTASNQLISVLLETQIKESQLKSLITATIPLAEPLKTLIAFTVPETSLLTDDSIMSLLKNNLQGFELAGRVSLEAKLRFLGQQPLISGRLGMTDGVARKDQFDIAGIALDMPFEVSSFFRTINRPTLSVKKAKIGKVQLDRGLLHFQVTPDQFFIDRMEVGWCKGQLNAYSIHLDFKKPDVDFIMYADRIDLGEALMMVLPFQGVMEGVLYGRIPVGVKDGRIKLSTGFLYSLPGQGGRLKLDDHQQMSSLLDKAGIQGAMQEPLSKALSNMDFTAFKVDLEHLNERDCALRFKVKGASNSKDWPAPVELNLNIYGQIEELLNMGLDMSRK